MKTQILLFILSAVLFVGCSKDDMETISITGRLISQVTGEGIEDATIQGRVKEGYGSGGLFSGSTEVSNNQATTDADGYFTMNLNYNEDDNSFSFEAIGAETTSLLTKKSFFLSEINDADFVELVARKYYELQVKIKNVDPFNNQDAIGVSFFTQQTNFHNNVISDIENFGDANELRGDPASEDGNNPYWISDNVDSVIYGKIQEGAEVIISWDVRKNGVHTLFQSDPIPTIIDEVTTFEINY